MREKPLLFSAPMVLAILDDLKNKTRRIIKHRFYDLATAEFLRMSVGVDGVAIAIFRVASGEEVSVRCPYGGAGHQLWVRETWGMNHYQFEQGPIPTSRPAEFDEPESHYLVYRASEDDAEIQNELRWWPSIHMPRWASRIQLEIISVGVERVQSITDEEGLAEGVRHESLGDTVWSGFMGVPRANCPGRTAFAILWMDINGQAAWGANPWVWVVEFKRVKP